jgi:hypothetical protein
MGFREGNYVVSIWVLLEGLRIEGWGFRVQGSGFRVEG